MSLIMIRARRMYGIMTENYLLLLSSSSPGKGQELYGAADCGSGVTGPAETIVDTPRTFCRSSSMLSELMTTEMVLRMVLGGGGLFGDGCTYGLSTSNFPALSSGEGVLSLTISGEALLQDRSFE